MHMEADTEPECYATDDAFLQSLAYCISTHCQGTPSWELERYWKMNVAGRAQYVFHSQPYWYSNVADYCAGCNQIQRKHTSKL